MGYNQSGSSSEKALQGLLNQVLCLTVNVCCGLIENQYFRIISHSPGDGEELSLPGGKGDTTFLQLRIQFAGQAGNQILQVSQASNSLKLS